MDAPLNATWLIEAVNYVSLASAQAAQAPGKGPAQPPPPPAQSSNQAMNQGVQVIEDVKSLLRGLVDLQRVEAAY
jgi:hypothetical protein